MKLKDLLQGTGVVLPADKEEVAIAAITCDSRRVEAGCLFVCIAGTTVDGHRYAADAMAAVAAADVMVIAVMTADVEMETAAVINKN